jgi:predicted DNA-binding antitoxin AbrB/MazE fold protein
MVIHAVYENGVFRPVAPVELPDNCEVDLTVQQSPGCDVQASAGSPLSKIAALASQYPPNPNLPADLAAQHDHYLHGAAKRS